LDREIWRRLAAVRSEDIARSIISVCPLGSTQPRMLCKQGGS